MKIERRPLRQRKTEAAAQEKPDLKLEGMKEFQGSLKRPKSSRLGKTPFSTELCGTSSLRCMCVRCIKKKMQMCLEKAIRLHMTYGLDKRNWVWDFVDLLGGGREAHGSGLVHKMKDGRWECD